jgi:hypothetical protein
VSALLVDKTPTKTHNIPFLPFFIRTEDADFIHHFNRQNHPLVPYCHMIQTCLTFNPESISIDKTSKFEITQQRISWEFDSKTNQPKPYLVRLYVGVHYYSWDKNRISLVNVDGNLSENELIWDSSTLSYFISGSQSSNRYMFLTPISKEIKKK